MKKIITILTLFTLQLFAAPSGIYIETGVGMNLDSSLETKNATFHYDEDFIFNVALGYQANAYRFELEGKYAKNKLSSYNGLATTGDLTQDSQMLNVYYSAYNDTRLITSVGAGAGISNLQITDMKQLGTAQKDITYNTIPSFQGMLSVGYMLGTNFIITTKYTFFYTLESDTLKAGSKNLVSLNLRVIF